MQLTPAQDPDLDDLLEESVGKPMGTEAPGDDDSPDLDLDDLLAESVGAVKSKREVEEARRRLRQSGTSGSSKLQQEDLDRIRQWEAANSWRAEALCAVFTVTRCDLCSSTRRVFTGLMVREHSRQSAFARRWVAVERTAMEAFHHLRRETGVIHARALMCEDCAPGLEWDLSNPVEISR